VSLGLSSSVQSYKPGMCGCLCAPVGMTFDLPLEVSRMLLSATPLSQCAATLYPFVPYPVMSERGETAEWRVRCRTSCGRRGRPGQRSGGPADRINSRSVTSQVFNAVPSVYVSLGQMPGTLHAVDTGSASRHMLVSSHHHPYFARCTE
jgi:hypothetical protein